MKPFIILIAFFVGVIAQPRAVMFETLKTCLEKETVSDNEKAEVLMKIFKSDDEPIQKAKCINACVLEEQKIMSPTDSSFNLDDPVENLVRSFTSDENKISEIINVYKGCSDEVNSTERCQRGYEFTKCLMPKIRKFLPRRNRGKNPE